MEKGFLVKVEDNAAVQIWAETTQQKKGDSLTEGAYDEAAFDLFDRLDKRVTPIPAILVETFRSLNTCRRTGEKIFIGCAQLLLPWLNYQFWKVEKVSYQIFFENYSPQKELVATPRQNDITKEKWMMILQILQDEDIEWKALWMVPNKILYRCGDFDWVSFLRIWGAVGYAPLLVLRQYRSRQFTLVPQGLAQCEFVYKGDFYKKKVHEISNAWNRTRRMKKITANPMTTPEYDRWWGQRINDNIPTSNQENTRSIEEHLQMI
ncbi:hypothetical protein Golax_022444 [Gossypium laxum]|uniref:DUF7745 domain-containing protein n=1 Tax=Gossypium laxum TaxID=34288 RepID=A0A7J9B5Z1_9ROSI|nr:hypothetical protein [Gossypium laxum]